MKKIFFVLIFALLLLPQFSHAAPNINVYTDTIAAKAGYDPVTELTLSETIGRYIRIMLSLVGTIFLALTVYAGFLWMTASGNEDQVTKATDIIKMATIGLIIALAASSITFFVVASVGSGTQTPQPQVGGGSAATSSGDFWSGFASGWSKASFWGESK